MIWRWVGVIFFLGAVLVTWWLPIKKAKIPDWLVVAAVVAFVLVDCSPLGNSLTLFILVEGGPSSPVKSMQALLWLSTTTAAVRIVVELGCSPLTCRVKLNPNVQVGCLLKHETNIFEERDRSWRERSWREREVYSNKGEKIRKKHIV